MLFTGRRVVEVTRILARRKELAWWVSPSLHFPFLSCSTSQADSTSKNSLVALGAAFIPDLFFGGAFHTERSCVHCDAALWRRSLLALIVFVFGMTGFCSHCESIPLGAKSNAGREAVRAGILYCLTRASFPSPGTHGCSCNSIPGRGLDCAVVHPDHDSCDLHYQITTRGSQGNYRQSISRQYGNQSVAAFAIHTG
jgi:hypothetical protein